MTGTGRTGKILIEICCGSVDDAIEAEQGGADRIELNSSLFLGGLTPSLGSIIEAKRRVNIPVMAMVRPRAGGFCYTEAEMVVMLRDVELAVEHNVDGVVFGILKPNGSIDIKRCRRLLKLVRGREIVFHRAFDVTPDPQEALDQLIELGFTRVLTSGQEQTVPEGIERLKELINYAGDRIEILPGGGIRPHNARAVVEQTGAKQVHLSAFVPKLDRSTQNRPHISFGGTRSPAQGQYDLVDRNIVHSIFELLNASP